jgi:hypothetical protein
MPRYIDADALLEKLRNDLPFKASVKRVLMQAPTADVVEVVRCNECKHCAVINGHSAYAVCRLTDFVFFSFETDTRKHFCAYGERKDNE